MTTDFQAFAEKRKSGWSPEQITLHQIASSAFSIERHEPTTEE